MNIRADARAIPLLNDTVDCVVTSPPYWGLRDYGNSAQIGLEQTPDAYVATIMAVFREVHRVLKPSGTLWLNLGDSYCNSDKWGGGGPNTGKHTKKEDGTPASWKAVRRKWAHVDNLKPKDLVGIPWMVAFALRADGWFLRSDVIWSKPNPMPESVTDRPTKAHEYLFLLTKSERYFYDAEAIAERVSLAMETQVEHGYDGLGLKNYEAAGVQNPSSVKARIIDGARRKNEQSDDRRKVGFNDRWAAKESEYKGKHNAADPNSSGRRMLKNAKENRDNGAAHDAPFGMTRNKRTVWTIPTMPYKGSHFATMPEKLIEPCILAGCPMDGLVFDPFLGSGTVGAVASRLGRRWVGTDLAYQDLSTERTRQRGLRFGTQ